MNCDKYSEQIDLMVTGELGEEDQASLHAHLEHCRDCRLLLNTIVQIRQEAGIERIPYPSSLDQKVMDRIAWINDAERKSHSWRRVPLPLAIAAALLLCATGFWIGRAMTPAPPPEMGRNSGSALVTNPAPVNILYAIPAVEIVGDYPAKKTFDTANIN